MKNALISPCEKVLDTNNNELGVRIAEVCDNPFEVAYPLYWVECADDVVADQWYWNGLNCIQIPQEPIPEVITSEQLQQVGPNVIA